MRLLKTGIVVLGAMAVSGCSFLSGNSITTDIEPLSPTDGAESIYRVEDVTIDVPQELIVSEANSYYPRGDIVWRGDPPGDRHEQVAAIFEDGAQRGVANLQGDVPVDVDIEVLRFHSLTEKTRYTVGGVHSIEFLLTVRDAETGEIIEPPREVKADLKGYGGSKAIAADQQGQTQKVRITAHLANVINAELTKPEGSEA